MKGSVSLILQAQSIGETAGEACRLLHSKGKSNLSAVEWGVHAPKSMVHMAIGWLAREGKVELGQEKRTIRVWLTEA